MTRSRKKKSNSQGKGLGLIKMVLGVLVLGGFGAGMYLAGQAQLLQSSPKPEERTEPLIVVKKPVASKPSRAFGAVLVDTGSTKENDFQYTFFEVLGDTGMKRFVDLNGNIVEKNGPVKVRLGSKRKLSRPLEIAKTPVPLKKSEEVQRKRQTIPPVVKKEKPLPPTVKVEAASQKNKSIAKELASVKKGNVKEQKSNEWVLSSLSQLKKKDENFWVQVASFKKLDKAQGMEEKLKLKGYFPFIRQIEIQGKGRWYRVFLGNYPSREIANRYAETARKELKLSPVVLKAG